ncbi:MAG: NYN domain-containing protein [Candidatus Geothermincolia bacterium]
MPDKPDMIIDAYNLMHADEEIERLMERDLEAARESLIASLCEYCAREEQEVQLVFDAGGRPGAATRERRTDLLTVVYTAAGQSADDYIEKLIYKSNRPYASTILVTGDYAQQRIAHGAGMVRMAPREFLERLRDSKDEWHREVAPRGGRPRKAKLADRLPEETVAALERLRKQQK